MQQVIERIYDRVCTDSVKGDWSRPLVDVLRETYRNVEILAGGLYPVADTSAVNAR
jgi:hypothetical protein